MTSENPYAPPVDQIGMQLSRGQGSLERALRGDYDFDVGEVIQESWELTKGAKLKLLAAFVVAYGISVGAGKLVETLLGLHADELIRTGHFLKGMLLSIIPGFIALPVTAPLFGGLAKMSMQRAVKGNPPFSSLFKYYPQIVPFTIVYLLTTLLIYVGLALLLIPGIYLGVGLMFAPYLMADRNLSPLQAIAISIKAVNHRWFGVFGVFLLTGLLVGVSAIPLGIGLIWTVPMFIIVGGVLYRTIFGVQNPELE